MGEGAGFGVRLGVRRFDHVFDDETRTAQTTE
jgi:hypothetical protein